MRILHVYKDYAPVVGGIENHIRYLAEGQVAGGHDVTVLATAPGLSSSAHVVRGVRVLRAGRLATVASTPISASLVGWLRRCQADVTHLHSPYPIGEAAWLLVGRGPMVLSYHSDIVRQKVLRELWAPFLRMVLSRAARIVAGSPVYGETSPFLRAVRSRVSVVPYGIDPARFQARDPARAKERYGDGPILAFVGRLRYYKGLDVLIDALAELSGVRLLVVGTGEMAGRWYQHAVRQGVADRVRWLGHVSDDELPNVLSAADVCVLPATVRSEAFGIALLEAMAAGLPVVSTELGTATSWVNVDGVTGRVVPPNDAPALAAALRELLDDRSTRSAMGQAARERVLEHFTLDRMIRGIEAIYEEVVA